MSLRIKHLNGDTSWLLIFSPSGAGHNPQGTFPGSFTIVIDPWISGVSTFLNSRFAQTKRQIPACLESIAELPEPDVIIVSQDKTDHCNEETLKQLPQDCETTILGPPAAVKKIQMWKHFYPENVQPLKRYDSTKRDTVHRITIPPFSPSGSEGEVTVTLIANKLDVTGLHNAIGITYRPPSSVLSAKSMSYINLPITPPTTPPASPSSIRPISSASGTVFPSPFDFNREKTLSVIYSPHGVGYKTIRPYAVSHLMAEAALPLTALFHCFDRATNPWYLGGNVCAGSPNGIEIAHSLCAKTWISSHDEDKVDTGIGTLSITKEKYPIDAIQSQMELLRASPTKSRSGSTTMLMQLEAGEEYYMPEK